MKQILLLPAIFVVMLEAFAQQPANVTVQDDAKVGLIVTGTGNTINTTQIFGKSPEYAELKKSLEGLAAAISKKADECEQMRRDSLPAKYRDNCRAELIALNAERDSVQKIETRFREDVIRLAETFSKIELNSERLRLAKQFFDEGKIREADNVLNAKEMQQEGDALLTRKESLDSLLRIKADEFALKARLKAADLADSLRYDSVEMYFTQSRRYAETVDNLWAFAYLLQKDNQTPRAITYCEKAVKLARSESEESFLSTSLGNLYSDVQKMAEAEKMYLRAFKISERLAKSNPTQFEPDLAGTCLNLGSFYYTNQKMGKAEKMYLRSLEIYERLAKSTPAQFEPNLASTCMNLGIFYKAVQKMAESEKMYLRSLEIYERLAKGNPAQFESDLATTCSNMGSFYYTVQKMAESEKMYLRSLEIYERLAKGNPAQFEPDLAMICGNLGIYYTAQKMGEAEKMFLRTFEIFERLAKTNPTQFEPDLAQICMNLGSFYYTVQKMAESEKMYSRALALHQKAVASGQTYFWDDLALTYNNMAALQNSFESRGDWAAVAAIQSERAACMDALSKVHPTAAVNAPRDYGSLSWYCLFARQYPESQAAAEKSLSLDPALNLVRTNLGHSHLLRGDWDKAKQTYEQYIAGEKAPTQAKAILLKDWDDLEKAGAIPKERMGDVEKARAWVKE